MFLNIFDTFYISELTKWKYLLMVLIIFWFSVGLVPVIFIVSTISWNLFNIFDILSMSKFKPDKHYDVVCFYCFLLGVGLGPAGEIYIVSNVSKYVLNVFFMIYICIWMYICMFNVLRILKFKPVKIMAFFGFAQKMVWCSLGPWGCNLLCVFSFVFFCS